MKTWFLLLFICFGGMSVAQSQGIKPVVPRKHFTFYFAPAGMQVTELGNMNTQLKANGYAPLTQNHYLLGAGFVFRYPKRALMLFDFNFGNIPNTRYGQKTTANLYGLCLGLGYEVIKNKRVSTFPYAGLGSSSLIINASKTDAGITQFNNYLGASPDGIQFKAFSANVKLGWQFDYSVALPSSHGKKIAIALNTGYSLPIATQWAQRNGKSLDDAPSVNIGGWYAKLMVGI